MVDMMGNTSQLSAVDRLAIATYVKSLPLVERPPAKKIIAIILCDANGIGSRACSNSTYNMSRRKALFPSWSARKFGAEITAGRSDAEDPETGRRTE
jgi:hypothetical protein